MRLLPVGPDHGCGRAAQGEARPQRFRYRYDYHQYLPLRDLSQDPHGDPPGGRARQGAESAPANPLDGDEGGKMGFFPRETGLPRRGFILASLSAAGGLMIGIRPVDAASPDSAGAELGAWIVIDPDESVTLRVAKS